MSGQLNIPIYIECELKNLNSVLTDVLKHAATNKVPTKNLIFYNLDIESQRGMNYSNDQLSYQININNLDFFKSLLTSGVTLGFDVYSYDQKEEELLILINFLCENNFASQILLSSGVKYKTHLMRYGNHGYSLITKFVQKLARIGVTQEAINQITKINILKLLNWWKPQKVKAVVRITWICATCKQEKEDNVQRFTKMGHEFCSVPCLRGFKG